MRNFAILFGACLLASTLAGSTGCVITDGSGGSSGSSGSSGAAGTATAGTAGAGVGGNAGTGGSATAGTGGATAGTGGATAGTGGTGGMATCAHCGVFVTDGGQLCADDGTAMTTDTTDFTAIIDCMCATGEGCETECKDTCPVGDGMPSDACIKCAADFTKDAKGTCKNEQNTCANDI